MSDPAGLTDEVISLVTLVAQHQGYECRVIDSDHVELGAGHGLRLTNLRQRLAQAPRDDWPVLVSDHLSTLLVAHEERFDVRDHPYELIRGLVRVKVWPADNDIPGHMISRPLAEGLIEALVVDEPTTVRNLHPGDIEHWPVEHAALFDIGLENVRADGPLHREDTEVSEVPLTIISGGFYACTHLHWLGDYLELGPLGALVTLPTRDGMLVHPVHDLSAVPAVSALRSLGQRFYDQGPGSVSAQVYWWRSGRLTMIPTRFEEDGGLVVLPPAEFTETLEGLSRPD